jgi:3-oxoacyl-[acyl-carrier-protein] synthase II
MISSQPRVVITGGGVVSPLGTGTERFFQGLREARSGIRLLQSFDASDLASRLAGEVPDLDPATIPLAFPEATALRRDPKGLFGLLACREALAQALRGTPLSSFFNPSRVGIAMATGLEIFHALDVRPHIHGDRLDMAGLHKDALAAPAHAFLEIPSDLAIRCVAREAGIRGPALVNVSACTASTQAIGEAFWAIRDGELDAVLTGGFDSMVNPLGVGGFCLLGALSESNHRGSAASRPFDADRDGFVLGEGGAALFLETLTSAQKRGATILAEVLGYGSTMDAFRVSDPDDHQRGAVAAIRAALADACLTPDRIDYINAHGTGTRKNDPAETAAIRAVFGPQAPPTSSTKSQIGHLIGAAGAVEAMAVLFALREQILPATINLTMPDPACDLDYVPNHPRPAPVHIALSNSFGFGGQNACLVLAAFRPTVPGLASFPA